MTKPNSSFVQRRSGRHPMKKNGKSARNAGKREEKEVVQAKRLAENMDVSGKKFVLKHVFNNVLSMKEGERLCSEQEEHFGVPWRIYVYKKNEHVGLFLNCQKSLETDKWSIETEFELKVISNNGNPFGSSSQLFGNINGNTKYNSCGLKKFIKWEEIMNFSNEGKLTAEAHVVIKKMTGIYKENLRNFDESMKEFSDVVLVVEDKKFYVLKKFLAIHSSYFNSMLLGNFKESEQSEISLNGIDSDDFQKFLEVLYGDSAIDESTVEAILILADMYDTKVLIRKCEEFLVEKSKKTLKKKLQMSTKYNMENLKNKCLSEIKTVEALRSVMPADIHEIHPSIATALLEKSMSLH